MHKQIEAYINVCTNKLKHTLMYAQTN